MPLRRGRHLSAEEIDLWLQVTRNVKPRPGRKRPEKPLSRSAPAEPSAPIPDQPRPTRAEPLAVESKRGGPPLASLERRLRRRLARGRADIDSVIDLHGMRQSEAQDALSGFLVGAQMDGARLVLVVTGKGRPQSPGEAGFQREAGVLRRRVPHWLRAAALRTVVVGFEEASAQHGGAGALYVRIRRRDLSERRQR